MKIEIEKNIRVTGLGFEICGEAIFGRKVGQLPILMKQHPDWRLPKPEECLILKELKLLGVITFTKGSYFTSLALGYAQEDKYRSIFVIQTGKFLMPAYDSVHGVIFLRDI